MDVAQRIAGRQRDGIRELEARSGDLALCFANYVVRATDVMYGVNFTDLPVASLRATIIIPKTLIEMERAAAHPAATIVVKWRSGFPIVFRKTPEERVWPAKNFSG